MVYADTNVF